MTSARGAIYVEQVDDYFRLGTFVHARLPNQDDGTTTIGKLIIREGSKQSIILYLPLFPRKKLNCHPTPPIHNYAPIEHSTGSHNIELYQTDVSMDIEDSERESIEVLYPAFVFHPSDLEKPDNSWAEGIKNVYVVRYSAFKNKDGQHKMTLANPQEIKCFPTDYQRKGDFPQLVIASRCYHKNVWFGLFQIRKALMKLLNRCSGQAESKSVQSLSIGPIPNEVLNYIFTLANSNVPSLFCHFFPGSESYLDIDGKLTRRKIRMRFEKGIIRFNTQNDLDMLRQFVGLPAVYGSTEIKPTLKDGSMGKELKRGHCLTIVKGCAPEDRPKQFKRMSNEQRVDLHFSPHQVRVTVGCQTYRYDTKADGSLKVPPPTDHLESTLLQTKHEETTNTVFNQDVLVDSHEMPDPDDEEEYHSPPKDKLIKNKEPSTFDKILAMDNDTSDTSSFSSVSVRPKEKSDLVSPLSEDDASIESMNTVVRCQVGKQMIYLGDSFFYDNTVYEISGIFPPGNRKPIYVLQHKEDFATYLCNKDPTRHHSPNLRSFHYIGKVDHPVSPTYLCRVVGGNLFRRKKSREEQHMTLFVHTNEIGQAITNYS